MRLLMWLILAALVYFAVKKNLRARSNKMRSEQTASNDWADASSTYSANRKESEAMLSCAHCQVYFPASEVVVRHQKNFCCIEHADQASGSSSS
ncbi:PP0621 family protein [Undibacterium sp. Di24W]|uniref:PP0621 family protein n=1 Tax=Undibacterium sp. Di24W TaxID=3413033 RepID=UPI003BF39B37